jgi:hypothetical protein
MMRYLLLLSLLMLVPRLAEAKEPEDATLLGCSFGAPGKAASADENSQKLYLLYTLDGSRNETISLIDRDSLLAGTTLKHRKTTVVDGGELWTFAESVTEPKGTILFVLPKSTDLGGGYEGRAAALGQYHGRDPRSGVCMITRGEQAITTFGGLRAGAIAK